MVLVALGVTMVLGGIFFAAGIVFSWSLALPEQLAAIISLSQMNSILVLVFSSQLFGPIEPMVAAMFGIMFFSLIVPIRGYQQWRLRGENKIKALGQG